MTRRQMYFVKQKLIGLLLIIVSVGLSLIFSDMWTVCLLSVPIGLAIVFTKKMVIVDDYYFYVKERSERAR